jgi:hypothetical protein
VTLWQIGERLVGEVPERTGGGTHPFIAWCHESTLGQGTADEVPWCSSFVNRLAWCLRMPRSKSAAARSWLAVGIPVSTGEAIAGANDVVILKRGTGTQPGPEVLKAPGHVGIFGGYTTTAAGARMVRILGGNQGDNVSVAEFPAEQVLGIRRIG